MQVIDGGDLAFSAIMYPTMNVNTHNYILEKCNNVSSTLTNIGRQCVEHAKEIYNKIFDIDYINIARNAINATSNLLSIDHIRALFTKDDFYQAPVSMQRYIMACPDIREVFNMGRCHGFKETYMDVDPGTIGEEHYDYRRVMNNVLVENSEGDIIHNEYCEDLLPGDRELDHNEKLDILTSWDIARMYFNNNSLDITNPLGGEI